MKFFRNTMKYLVAFCVFISAVNAQQIQPSRRLIATYQARLSINDHFNSKGIRLSDAFAIIRQDRANFFTFGIRDCEDEFDIYFNSRSNREVLQTLVQRAGLSQSLRRIIANETPLIQVSIYRSGGVDSAQVKLLARGKPLDCEDGV